MHHSIVEKQLLKGQLKLGNVTQQAFVITNK